MIADHDANQPTDHDENIEKVPYGRNRGLAQAYQIRDLAANEAIALRELPAKTLEDHVSRAQALRCLAVVWKDASDRVRILRGRPLPGSLRPESKPKRKASSLARTLSQKQEVREQRSEVSATSSPKPSPSPTPPAAPIAEPEAHA